MSRVYWHTKDRTVELRGSERAWLSHVANGPAEAAWDLNASIDSVKHAVRIINMVPEEKRGYVGEYLRAAQQTADWPTAQRLTDALGVHLRVDGFDFQVAGHTLHSYDVGMNTTLVAGSDVLRLAAKIHGYCESHMWIDEPDQEWVAGIIDDGLQAGIFRSGVWYEPAPGAERKWSSQGWDDVTELLRSPDTGPVVLSYSVCESFPSRHLSDWQPPEDDPDGDSWYELPGDEQWDLAFAGLASSRPWLQLTPESLTGRTFGPPVTFYDLFAPDRDERVRRAFAGALVPAAD